MIAFILVLGILVDDAIVVGERIHTQEQIGKPPMQAAIDGTWEVSIPVIFGVLTTVAAFLPLVLVEGGMGDFFGAIGVVVMVALVFSIIESQLILPAHLAHRKRSRSQKGLGHFWNGIQGRMADALEALAVRHYLPLVRRAIEWRYVTAAIAWAC